MSATDFRSLQATFVPRPDAPGQGRLYFWCMPPRRVDYARKALSSLGVLRKGKSPPTGRIELVIPTPTRNKTEDWEIAELTGIRLPLVETIRGLVRLDLHEARQRRVSDAVRVWSMAAKLAVELVASGQMIPLLDRNDTDQLTARWAITALTPQTRERIAALEKALPIAGYSLVLDDGQVAEPGRKKKKGRRRRKRKPVTADTTVWRPEYVLRAFLDAVADSLARAALPSTSRDRPRKDNRELAPWELRWRYALTASDPAFESAGLVERSLVNEISRWASPVRPKVLSGTAYSVLYQLELPGTSPETRDVNGAWFLRYMLQANDDPSVVVDARAVWDCPERKLVVGDRTLIHPHETLLESLAETAKLFGPVARSLRSPQPPGVILSTEEAWEFISTVSGILTQFGVGVRVPRELRAHGRQRLRLKLHVGGNWDFSASKGSKVGMQSVTAFHWQVALGEHDLSAQEFREIAAMKEPLVQWRGEWMAVDPTELAEMERLFANADNQGEMDRAAAMAHALAGTMTVGGAIGDIEVVAEGEIQRIVDLLRSRDASQLLPTPKGFRGDLRPYQQRGLTWLKHMTDMGFGLCLADDMGLGKTVQIIALLLASREDGVNDPTLLVCPTSVLGNWQRELQRFAPSLRVLIHHGRGRSESDAMLKRDLERHDVILTTYVIARMDQETLAQQRWAHLIVDEAQNVKNPDAQQARAIRAIPAERRMALTGTPVENRLTELWSILEFANPGMLGGLSEFRSRFAVPIERFGDRGAADTLKRLVSPFILRRVKTDPNVIQDLPEKQEYKVWCTLTREQATLYQASVDKALARIEKSTGLERKGNILALLTALKQICNHPTQYLKEKESLLRGRSGKLTRLTEMLEEVIAEGDYALIFTQYKEMGDLLVTHLQKTFGIELPFIHGGVPQPSRERIVNQFQNDPDAPPLLLLSLKAGGTGLNLTRATHVFHFDRWWNPAVEDQATDRAFRIGQTRNVQVHKLVVAGTVEEKIDEILVSKRDLADRIVGVGEEWLTELSDGELRSLVSLGKLTAIDEDAEAPA